MFLNELSKDERLVFLKLAFHLTTVDGEIDDLERKVLKTYCFEADIHFSEIDYKTLDEATLISLAKTIKDKKSKRIILIELFSLAYVNGEFHEDEKKFMLTLSEIFGLSDDEIKSLESWSERMVNLIDEGLKLVEGRIKCHR